MRNFVGSRQLGAIQVWGEEKLGVAAPIHTTGVGRSFPRQLDPSQFEACFLRWMSPLFPPLADQVVAIDGKTVRGSRLISKRAIPLVSAHGSALGMVQGQVRTAQKSNEVTAIPELLDALLLKGAILTIDAMGCQRSIAEQIVNAGVDYVLKRLSAP